MLHTTIKHLSGKHNQKVHGRGGKISKPFVVDEKRLLKEVRQKSNFLAAESWFAWRENPNKYVRTLSEDDLLQYLYRTTQHRKTIAEEAIKVLKGKDLPEKEIRQLLRNIVRHDVDKYDLNMADAYADFFAGRKVKDSKKFKAAIRKHHEINGHHATFWVDKRGKAKEMPRIFVFEMVADMRGTAKEKGTGSASDFYRKHAGNFNMHPKSRKLLESEFRIKRDRKGKIIS